MGRDSFGQDHIGDLFGYGKKVDFDTDNAGYSGASGLQAANVVPIS